MSAQMTNLGYRRPTRRFESIKSFVRYKRRGTDSPPKYINDTSDYLGDGVSFMVNQSKELAAMINAGQDRTADWIEISPIDPDMYCRSVVWEVSTWDNQGLIRRAVAKVYENIEKSGSNRRSHEEALRAIKVEREALDFCRKNPVNKIPAPLLFGELKGDGASAIIMEFIGNGRDGRFVSLEEDLEAIEQLRRNPLLDADLVDLCDRKANELLAIVTGRNHQFRDELTSRIEADEMNRRSSRWLRFRDLILPRSDSITSERDPRKPGDVMQKSLRYLYRYHQIESDAANTTISIMEPLFEHLKNRENMVVTRRDAFNFDNVIVTNDLGHIDAKLLDFDYIGYEVPGLEDAITYMTPALRRSFAERRSAYEGYTFTEFNDNENAIRRQMINFDLATLQIVIQMIGRRAQTALDESEQYSIMISRRIGANGIYQGKVLDDLRAEINSALTKAGKKSIEVIFKSNPKRKIEIVVERLLPVLKDALEHIRDARDGNEYLHEERFRTMAAQLYESFQTQNLFRNPKPETPAPDYN